jgi:hypothetical protein
MKTQLKRILSVLLSMTLVWNLLPMQALATETDSSFVTRGKREVSIPQISTLLTIKISPM